MKHILTKITLAAALVLGVSGCNMDLRPYSVIDPENALETYADAEKLANGFNVQIRSLSSGSIIYSPELQSDLFHATSSFGNRNGLVYRWTFTSSEGIFESVYLACYSAIANANYFIEKAASIESRVAGDPAFADTWTEDELKLLKGHVSEAYFLRAYAYSILVDRYCDAYDEATAGNENTGVALSNRYNPTSDKAQYPGKTTLEASYDQIYSDLEAAQENIGLLRESAAGSLYVTEDVVKALRARVALARHDYAQAIQDATEVINSGKYELVSGTDALNQLWTNDNQAGEVLLQCAVALTTEMPSTNNANYLGYNYQNDVYSPDFVPEKWLVDLYDDTDYRRQVYFKSTPVQIGGITTQEPVLLFNKFPGNPALMTGESDYNYVNAPKPFRLAELYLIAAEAYLNSGMSNGVQEASRLLNELQGRRHSGWENVGYTQNQLAGEIADERVRELVGEGFRLSDLRRYGNGMTRTEGQLSSILYLPGSNTTELFSVNDGDYRFVWAIPQAEIDANPNMRQNPGYTNSNSNN